MKTLITLVLLTLATIPDSYACRDPLSETHTFFKELPRKLASKEVVAKIKVLSFEKTKEHERLTTAKIVSAIRGTKAGKSIKILSDLSSCNRDPEIQKNQEYFIAGKIGPDGLFRGTWRQQELIEQK